jgi:hypothetical protein
MLSIIFERLLRETRNKEEKEIQKEIAAILRQITSSVSFLPLLVVQYFQIPFVSHSISLLISSVYLLTSFLPCPTPHQFPPPPPLSPLPPSSRDVMPTGMCLLLRSACVHG